MAWWNHASAQEPHEVCVLQCCGYSVFNSWINSYQWFLLVIILVWNNKKQEEILGGSRQLCNCKSFKARQLYHFTSEVITAFDTEFFMIIRKELFLKCKCDSFYFFKERHLKQTVPVLMTVEKHLLSPTALQCVPRAPSHTSPFN